MRPAFADSVAASVAEQLGPEIAPDKWQPVAGGDINETYRFSDRKGRHWFIKLNDASRADMFVAEAASLTDLSAAQELKVPEVAGFGSDGRRAWLILEWLELSGDANDALLGRALARMHRVTAVNYGWYRNNYIGRTAQPNKWTENWVEFFRDQRIGHQLMLAGKNGAPSSLLESGQQLLKRMEEWFADYRPSASLLHGDLWGGNKGALPDGSPVLFDPAVYYGDRETDIAMTHLFGGFGSKFYRAYDAEWPLDTGADRRRDLYNLYHVLNHFNLFGGAYLAQAERIQSRLLQGISYSE